MLFERNITMIASFFLNFYAIRIVPQPSTTGMHAVLAVQSHAGFSTQEGGRFHGLTPTIAMPLPRSLRRAFTSMKKVGGEPEIQTTAVTKSRSLSKDIRKKELHALP